MTNLHAEDQTNLFTFEIRHLHRPAGQEHTHTESSARTVRTGNGVVERTSGRAKAAKRSERKLLNLRIDDEQRWVAESIALCVHHFKLSSIYFNPRALWAHAEARTDGGSTERLARQNCG